jgi:hypothetical protein
MIHPPYYLINPTKVGSMQHPRVDGNMEYIDLPPEKAGTRLDISDMHRMGKKQEFKVRSYYRIAVVIVRPHTLRTAELQLRPHLRVCGCADDDMCVRFELRKLRSSEWWPSGSHLDLCCYALRIRLCDHVHGWNGVHGAHKWRTISLGVWVCEYLLPVTLCISH